MSSKVLVIIATSDKEKALTALMYAKNTQLMGWMEDVKVVFFGPSERLLVEDSDIAREAKAVAAQAESIACKFISDRDNISEKIEQLGVKIEYVGTIISDHIKTGYTPMVW